MVSFVSTFRKELIETFEYFNKNEKLTKKEEENIEKIQIKLKNSDLKICLEFLTDVLFQIKLLYDFFQKKDYNAIEIKEKFDQILNFINKLTIIYSSISGIKEIIKTISNDLSERFSHHFSMDYLKIFFYEKTKNIGEEVKKLGEYYQIYLI